MLYLVSLLLLHQYTLFSVLSTLYGRVPEAFLAADLNVKVPLAFERGGVRCCSKKPPGFLPLCNRARRVCQCVFLSSPAFHLVKQLPRSTAGLWFRSRGVIYVCGPMPISTFSVSCNYLSHLGYSRTTFTSLRSLGTLLRLGSSSFAVQVRGGHGAVPSRVRCFLFCPPDFVTASPLCACMCGKSAGVCSAGAQAHACLLAQEKRRGIVPRTA